MNSQSALSKIPKRLLINGDSFNFTKTLLGDDRILTLYIHKSGDPIVIDGGGYGRQQIDPLPISRSFRRQFKDVITGLEDALNIDFRFMSSADQADIDFYLDSVIDVGDEGIVGLALENRNTPSPGYELILDGTAINDESYLLYAAIHELGHALHLEHPFSDADGDVYQSIDPWTNAYPEQTVMAYRDPLSDRWPSQFSANDLRALVALYGSV